MGEAREGEGIKGILLLKERKRGEGREERVEEREGK